MEHSIVELEAFDGVGIRTECPGRDISSIGPLWDRFFETPVKVEGSTGVVGLSWGDGGGGGFSYLAAHKVPAGSGAALVTDGLESYSVPAGRYVSVLWQGDVKQMSAAFQDIFKRIIPEGGLEMHPEGACIEDYPADCWDEATGQMKCELLVRVK